MHFIVVTGEFSTDYFEEFSIGLDIPEHFVHMMANSRRGPWEMSRNLNNALDTRYWQAQGLVSMLECYLALR